MSLFGKEVTVTCVRSVLTHCLFSLRARRRVYREIGKRGVGQYIYRYMDLRALSFLTYLKVTLQNISLIIKFVRNGVK